MATRLPSQLLSSTMNKASFVIHRSILIMSILLTYSTSNTSNSLPSLVVAESIDFPESITLRGGVLHAPPFAMTHDDGNFTGFQIDLIERIKIFAANDGVELNIILDVAPPQYGPAFDLVANDCNTTSNPNPLEDCQKFDLIIGNYYATADRSLRVDLSPAWLRSTISTIRLVDYDGPEILTLDQASTAGATVCMKQATFYSGVVMAKHPGAEYLFCGSHNECVDLLKDQQCVLYPDDELQLRFREVNDPTVQMTKEHFNTQYIVWPVSFKVDKTASLLLNRWIYSAIINATLDELYFNYFEKQQCPYGTAGENCELFCHPDHGESNLEGVCVCESAKWTGEDCSIEVEEDYNFIPPTLKLLGYIMFGINAFVVVFCAVWLFVERNAAQVHVSQPYFLLLVLLGCLISSSTIVALAQEDNPPGTTVQACMAIPWTYSIGFSITFGSLFAKIRRVHRIFKSAADMRRAVVTVGETLLIIGFVLLIDLAVLITWTVVDPLQWQRDVLVADKFGEPLSSVGYCTSNHWKVFSSIIAVLHFGLLGVASYLCYVTRNISTNFSQGKYIAIAMVSNLQIFVVGVPVLVIVGSDSDTGFFVRSVIIWMNDLMVVLVIFGNLMYSVWSEPKATLQQTIQNATRNYLSNANSSQMLSPEENTKGSLRGRDSMVLNRYSVDSMASRNAPKTGEKGRVSSVISASIASVDTPPNSEGLNDLELSNNEDTSFSHSSTAFHPQQSAGAFKPGLHGLPEEKSIHFDLMAKRLSSKQFLLQGDVNKDGGDNNKSLTFLEKNNNSFKLSGPPEEIINSSCGKLDEGDVFDGDDAQRSQKTASTDTLSFRSKEKSGHEDFSSLFEPDTSSPFVEIDKVIEEEEEYEQRLQQEMAGATDGLPTELKD